MHFTYLSKIESGAMPPPAGLPVSGVVLADQVRSTDWRGRDARPFGRVPREVIAHVLRRLDALLE